MKKSSMIGTFILSLAWFAAWGGLFEVCTLNPSSPAITNTCALNSYGDGCVGGCVKVQGMGSSSCQQGWGICVDGSYNVWFNDYDGTCDFGKNCACQLPPNPTGGGYFPMGCMQPPS
jgi:hypothetical protein